MIHLPTWLLRHSIEITPGALFVHGGLTILETDIAIITRDCPKRVQLLEGRDIYNKSDNHKILMFGMLLNLNSLAQFCRSARSWLDLPIHQLGGVRFDGEYELGLICQNRFGLTFREYILTPSKTDWMSVEVSYMNGEESGNKTLHVDYTCLNEFVSGFELWSEQNDNVLNTSYDTPQKSGHALRW